MGGERAGATVVVTDSTAYLPDHLVEEYGIHVVPLHVVIDGVSAREGIEVRPADVARALRDPRGSVTTSRATPEEFFETYQRLFDAGAGGVVSVHVSRRLSGTFEAAEAAAGRFGDRVSVVDSGSAGMGLGFAVLTGAATAARGGTLGDVGEAVTRAVGGTRTLFYVDTLEFLRRGGRIGTGEALLGTALAVKPILEMTDGGIALREKVRTAARALARLEDLTVAIAANQSVDLAVHHLDNPGRAGELADRLQGRLRGLRTLYTSEIGAVVGAHAGPGVVAVVVHRHPADA